MTRRRTASEGGGRAGAGVAAGRVTQQQRKVEWKSTKQSERKSGEMRDGR